MDTLRRDALIEEMRELLHNAESRGYLTDDEQREYDEKMAEVRRLNVELAEAEARDQARAGVEDVVRPPGEPEHRTEGRADVWLPSLREMRQLEDRAVNSSGSSAAAFLPQQQASTYFDHLRANSVVLESGPRVLTTNRESLKVPKLTSGVSVSMVAEGDPIPTSDPAMDAVELTPKKLGVITRATNEALDDSEPDLRRVIADNHVRQAAVHLDGQLLEGDGSGANLTALRHMAAPSTAVNGTPHFDDVIDAIEAVERNSGRPSAIFMAPRTWADFKRIQDADSRYQLTPDPSQDQRLQLFGIPVYVTGNISTDFDDDGDGVAEESWIGVVDLEQLVVARRQDVRVSVSEDAFWDTDEVGIRSVARFDVAPVHTDAIHLLTGVKEAA